MRLVYHVLHEVCIVLLLHRCSLALESAFLVTGRATTLCPFDVIVACHLSHGLLRSLGIVILLSTTCGDELDYLDLVAESI